MPRKSVLDLQRMKAGSQRIAMITAYDATTARRVDKAGVDVVLVGDSLGMVVQGREDTLGVTMDDMIYHGRCVARGLQSAHLTIDMPFMSYQVSPTQALDSIRSRYGSRSCRGIDVLQWATSRWLAPRSIIASSVLPASLPMRRERTN